MASIRNYSEGYVRFLLKYRIAVILVIGLATAFFAYQLLSLRVATDFFTLYPPKHEHIKLYNEYRKMFGTANVLVCAVEVKEGDIFNVKTIEKIDRVTRAMMAIEGVNTQQVISLTHPKVKRITVQSTGIEVVPLVRYLPKNDIDLEWIREGVNVTAGIRGIYVSHDDKAATAYAGFWEEGVDPNRLYERLQEIKARESDENTNIRFTGFPTLYSYIYHLAPQVYTVLIVTFAVIMILLFFYFRSWRGVVLPTFSALLSAVWGLGFASLLDINLDPLILVVPVIISARCLSHCIQTLARYNEEYYILKEKRPAIVKAYGEMLKPSILSLVTDGVGVLLIAIVTIPLMRNLAFFASFWIASIFICVDTLCPILLSFFKRPSEANLRLHHEGGKMYRTIARMMVLPSLGKTRNVTLALVVLILVFGGALMSKQKVGDTETGAVMLFAEHPYNQDNKYINTHFAGANQLVIIAEGKRKGAVRDAKTLMQLERMQHYMESEGGAGASLTFTNLIKKSYRMFHEGIPKWEMIPAAERFIAQIAFLISTQARPGEMDRYLDSTWTNATVTCFYPKYNNTTIRQSVEKAREFIAAKENESDAVRYRLAGGIMGILYAVNEEVTFSYWASLIAVFVAVFILCILIFRSFAAGLVLVIPLAVSQIFCNIFMMLKGIDLNINSLPVAAIAVGIGVDYGIYLTARISEEYRDTGDYDIANHRALQTTGRAIIFTATTMVAGVIFWTFIDLKFQAEMGLLLGLLMLFNMVNALVLIPVLVKFFKPRFVAGTSVQAARTDPPIIAGTGVMERVEKA